VFADHIKKVVDNVDGGIAALIMGLDGIAVETYVRDGARVDINTIGMEFSFILTQVKKAAEILQVGGIQEVAIKAERLTLIIRMLSDDYFFAVAVGPAGNFGKCRFLMRTTAQRLSNEL
jgi:predicted regulator of Ras-like GTPase activity (Roadblock/LC7/MglB family)